MSGEFKPGRPPPEALERVTREALERIPEGGRSGASGGRWNGRTRR